MRVEVGGHVEAVLLSVHVVMPLGRWTGLRPVLARNGNGRRRWLRRRIGWCGMFLMFCCLVSVFSSLRFFSGPCPLCTWLASVPIPSCGFV